jgi:hypothetical protein
LGEEAYDAAHFVGLSHPVHWDVLEELVQHERGDRGDHVGLDQTRGDGIDGHPHPGVELAPLCPECVRAFQAQLAGSARPTDAHVRTDTDTDTDNQGA